MNIDMHGHLIVPGILRSDTRPEAWRPEITRQPNGWQMIRNNRFVNGPIPREVIELPRIIEHLDRVQVDVMVASPRLFSSTGTGRTHCAAGLSHPERRPGFGREQLPTRLVGMA